MDSNDIELFSTTDFEAKSKVVSALVRHRVSYLERWEKIPLLRRREFGGAKELCVIYVNGNQYGKAKKILDEFTEAYTEARKEKRRRKKAAQRAMEEEERAEREERRQQRAMSERDTGDDVEDVDDVDEGLDEF